MPLSSAEKKSLRAQAHSLNPVVQTGGKGLTDAVMVEIEAALAAHELIKVRFAGMERADRKTAAAQVAKTTKSELVGEIGAIAILFRAKPEKPPIDPVSSHAARKREPGRRKPTRS